MAAFLNFLATARYQAERLVALRTDELNKEKEMLRESEERFRQVAVSTGEFIWECDATGLYTYASPLAERMYGYRSEELVGKKYFYDFFLPEERERLKQEILSGFAQKLTFKDFPNDIVHRDGNTVLLSTTAMPILDNSGNLLGYRGVDTDITEKRLAEQKLKQSEERYKKIITSITGYIYTVYIKDNKVVDTAHGAGCVSITGYSAEEFR